MKKYILLLMLSVYFAGISAQIGYHFTHISIDSTKQKWGDWAEPDWLRYFGQDAADVNHDGWKDILSGRYLYLSPGGNLTGSWERIALEDNVDGIFLMQVDDDPHADIIAMSLPDIYWYEATDQSAKIYNRRKVASVPATSHVNSQGFERLQMIPGGKEEILIAGDGNIYLIEIPENHSKGWKTTLIAANTSDEGIGYGDLDGDGDLDVAAGRRPPGEGEPKILVWFENPGNGSGNWKDFEIGTTTHPIDRVEIADLDSDGVHDVIITEERYPGLEPDGHLIWYNRKSHQSTRWKENVIVTQYSMNNLDLADFDRDGDMDIITNEHKGPRLELQLWENDGKGVFTKNVLDTGNENHLGTMIVDLDGDGDLDIYGGAWDKYENVHVWRNDEIKLEDRSDAYRLYPWTPTMVSDEGKFLRVGGKIDYQINKDHFPADHHHDGYITLEKKVSKDGAQSATLIVERVQSHEDTKNLQVQWNQSAWITIPEPQMIPGTATDFMFHSNIEIPIPLAAIHPGENNQFRFRVAKDQAWNWPQNLIYGVILKVDYQQPTVSHQIELKHGTDNLTLSLPHLENSAINSVHYVGLYEDINWQGDGFFRQWQMDFHRGKMYGHIGSAEEYPYKVRWDTEWIPNQELPIKIKAIAEFKDGLFRTIGIRSGVEINRDHEVHLIKPYDTPSHWVTRSKEHSQISFLPDHLTSYHEGRMFWKSWSPCYNEGIRINDEVILTENDEVILTENDDPCYDAYFHQVDIPKSVHLLPGKNTITTLKTPLHHGQMVHGMEVQYPGIMIKLKSNTTDRSITETGYEGRPHYKIRTPTATYYYDKAGGGFSRIIDREGNDWVGFKKDPWGQYPASASSAYRGIPNLVFGGENNGAGHPGFDRCISTIENGKILTKTIDGKWAWNWSFSDHQAHLSITKTDPERNYWFLYEGTPGGRYSSDDLYFGTDQITRTKELPDFYAGKSKFDKYKWAYFGRKGVSRAFYLVQDAQDDQPDMLGFLGDSVEGISSKDGMTVFGFGRGKETDSHLSGKQEFTIGFFPISIDNEGDHRAISLYLDILSQ